MQFIMQLTQGISQAWTHLSVSARVNLVIASLLSVVLVVAMVLIETKPHYVPLFPTAVESAESAKVQAYLADQGIPFQLANGGQSVLVPVDQRSGAMVALSEQGIPAQLGGQGFELMEKGGLLVSDQQQAIQYQRALAGELMRMLNQFDFVRRSVAFVSIPKEELFALDAQAAQASVTLDLKRPVTSVETKALLNVISAFGNGRLSPTAITIMGTDGTPIHVPSDDSTAGIAGSKLEVVENWERQREKKLEELLRSMGAVAATVAVGAQVDFKDVRETVTEVTDGIAVTTQSTKNTVSNQPQVGGAPGATSNPPEGVVQGGGLASVATKEENIDTLENIEPSTRTTETTIEPGSIYSFSVSATVDMGHRRPIVGADGKETGEQEYVPLQETESEAIRTMLASAAGGMKPEDVKVFDQPIRIDKLESVEEARQDVLREATGYSPQEYATIAGKLGLVLLGFLVVRSLLKRSMVPVDTSVDEPLPVNTASPEDVRKQKVASEVERMSKESPESVAALLRSWLSEAEE